MASGPDAAMMDSSDSGPASGGAGTGLGGLAADPMAPPAPGGASSMDPMGLSSLGASSGPGALGGGPGTLGGGGALGSGAPGAPAGGLLARRRRDDAQSGAGAAALGGAPLVLAAAAAMLLL